jgi:hypothetical protein
MIANAMIELPRPDIKRWTVRHKAAVILAVRVGMISLQDACLRYNLSVEEFLAWQRAVERHGLHGLRVTRLQVYRDTADSRGQGRRRAAALGRGRDDRRTASSARLGEIEQTS